MRVALPSVADIGLRGWWPLPLGLAVMLLSSYVRFFDGVWKVQGNDHGPVLVAIALFLLWFHRQDISAASSPRKATAGWVLVAVGALLYLFGVRTRFAYFEAAAHVLLVAGAIHLVGGAELLRRLWFALLFLALSIPLPTFLVAQLTEGLKSGVTTAAVDLLYACGLPIARDGAVITIGYYQLLVAEACAGMNSIISLSAVGLLYLYLVPPRRLWQLALALASIVPIAVAANVLRIVILSLVTYYLGDEAGQGFLHEFAGMVMFLFALAALIGFTRCISGRSETGVSGGGRA